MIDITEEKKEIDKEIYRKNNLCEVYARYTTLLKYESSLYVTDPDYYNQGRIEQLNAIISYLESYCVVKYMNEHGFELHYITDLDICSMCWVKNDRKDE